VRRLQIGSPASPEEQQPEPPRSRVSTFAGCPVPPPPPCRGAFVSWDGEDGTLSASRLPDSAFTRYRPLPVPSVTTARAAAARAGANARGEAALLFGLSAPASPETARHWRPRDTAPARAPLGEKPPLKRRQRQRGHGRSAGGRPKESDARVGAALEHLVFVELAPVVARVATEALDFSVGPMEPEDAATAFTSEVSAAIAEEVAEREP
jgi:hypothetical protein